jgi:phosphoribosylanthranilate isomerase
MTWVKICGMTNLEDALVAVDAGADAVGFVFYEKSPRNVSVETAREIVEQLPGRIEKVGVFAGNSMDFAVEAGHRAGFSALQIYPLTFRPVANKNGSGDRATGAPGMSMYLAFPVAVFLGEGARNVAGFAMERPEGIFDRLFLDSGNSRQPGGTGETFAWAEAASTIQILSQRQKVVIAGGLKPENVAEAIGMLKPFGVDVSSGVEARPGKKDPEKVRAFVKAVREMDRKTS